jgi:hypothetical protein
LEAFGAFEAFGALEAFGAFEVLAAALTGPPETATSPRVVVKMTAAVVANRLTNRAPRRVADGWWLMMKGFLPVSRLMTNDIGQRKSAEWILLKC